MPNLDFTSQAAMIVGDCSAEDATGTGKQAAQAINAAAAQEYLINLQQKKVKNNSDDLHRFKPEALTNL